MAGEVAIGCGESVAMTFLSTHIRAFRALHPQVQFRIYSANADDVKERIEKGLLDMGLLTEPVDIGRYAFLRTPQKNRWGVLVPKEHPLAQRESVTPEDLLDTPLLMSGRERVRGELAAWFGDAYEKIEVAATFNLTLNAANMVKNGVGAALCFDLGDLSDALTALRHRSNSSLSSKMQYRHLCFLKTGIRQIRKTVIQCRHPKGCLHFYIRS